MTRVGHRIGEFTIKTKNGKNSSRLDAPPGRRRNLRVSKKGTRAGLWTRSQSARRGSRRSRWVTRAIRIFVADNRAGGTPPSAVADPSAEIDESTPYVRLPLLCSQPSQIDSFALAHRNRCEHPFTSTHGNDQLVAPVG